LWAKKTGISTGVIGSVIFLYIMYSVSIGAMVIDGYSGDVVCAGTVNDPCYAYINFTAKEDMFWYPTNYDPYGRNTTFAFNPAVKSWELQRSWGSNWKTIPMDKPCTGTWCGAPDSKSNVTYSVVWRAGKSYQLRIVGYKKKPSDTIKWGFGNIDPKWLGTGIILNDEVPTVHRWELKGSGNGLVKFTDIRIERITDNKWNLTIKVNNTFKQEIMENQFDYDKLKNISKKYFGNENRWTELKDITKVPIDLAGNKTTFSMLGNDKSFIVVIPVWKDGIRIKVGFE